MLGSLTFRAWVLVASSLIACKFEAADEFPMVDAEAGKSGDDDSSSGHTAARAGTSSRSGGEGGASGDDTPGNGGQSSPEGGSESGATGASGSDGAGAAGDAGAGGTGDVGSECDITTGCAATCQEESATCTVAPLDFACEFVAVAGESAQVACGEMAVVGMACCGGCGCVDVKVYFDGHKCWQGIPDCQIDLFTDKLFSSPQ
jgi:hypothetical protein